MSRSQSPHSRESARGRPSSLVPSNATSTSRVRRANAHAHALARANGANANADDVANHHHHRDDHHLDDDRDDVEVVDGRYDTVSEIWALYDDVARKRGARVNVVPQFARGDADERERRRNDARARKGDDDVGDVGCDGLRIGDINDDDDGFGVWVTRARTKERGRREDDFVDDDDDFANDDDDARLGDERASERIDWDFTRDGTFANVSVGGTFDRLHAGHRALLATAMRATSDGGTLYVGVTSENVLGNKAHVAFVEPYARRAEAVGEFLKQCDPLGAVEVRVGALDKNPPLAATAREMNALVISRETVAGAEALNDMRASAGYEPLKLIVVDLVGGDANEKLSSTELRALDAARAAESGGE